MALTFDDGPNGQCTTDVLDALAATTAPATFFLVGAFVDLARDDVLLARMAREGHTIGVHAYWHNAVRRTFFADLTATDIQATVESVGRAFARAGAAAPPITYYRPPFGFLTRATQRGVALAGFTLVTWSLSVEDWPHWRRAQDIVDPIVAQVKAGDVIVLHDGNESGPHLGPACFDHPALGDAVRLLVPALRARGLEPTPLADVLSINHSAAAAP